MPFLSALVGWIIARLFIILVFHPVKPAKLPGFTFRGVLLRQRHHISAKLSRLVSQELFSFREIEQKILTKGNFEKILPEVEVHIDHFLAVKLKEKMPMVGMFVGERTLGQLKEIFMEELETLFPAIMKSYVAGLESNFNVEQLVIEKLSAITDEKFSAYVRQVTSGAFHFVPLVGALLGFIIGSIQLIILLFLN